MPSKFHSSVKKQSQHKTVVYIFGMGKSGTSLVSQIVQDIAGYRDENQTQGRMDNVLGFYENKDLVMLNSVILSKKKVDWPVRKRKSFDRQMNFPELEKSAVTLLRTLFKDNDTVVLKDPRLTFTLPFWIKISRQYRQKFIFVFRYPGEVALSLAKAAGFKRSSALISWSVNNELGLEIISKHEVLMISYAELMLKPQTEILRTYSYLGIKPGSKQLAADIYKVVPEIRHYNFNQNDFERLGAAWALYKRIATAYKKNRREFGFDAKIRPPKLSDSAKVAILRKQLKKMDELIRKQFEETQALGVEYQNQITSNMRLAEENRKMFLTKKNRIADFILKRLR